MAESVGVSREIKLLLENIVKKDIKNFIVTVTKNAKGQGFLGDTIYLLLKAKDGGKSFDLVVKQAGPNESLRKKFPVKEIYATEIYFYTKVWEKFQEFWISFQPGKLFDVPKCLAGSSKEFSEVLILENLKLQNFLMFDKKRSFDRDHVELLFSVYGRFHAISFAYKILNSNEYLEVSKGLEDIWYVINDYKYFPVSVKNIHETSLSSLLPEDSCLEKYRKFVENGLEIFTSKSVYNGNYSAILHGDCNSGNMLFKYESGKVVDVRLIDFQFSRVGTPVYDLSYCIYSSTEKEIYDNLDYYLKVYHNSLSNTLKDFGCDGEALYPFVALKEEWKKYSVFGYTMALMVWRSMLIYEESALDLTDFQNDGDEIAEGFMATKYDEETFKKISRDLILHMFHQALKNGKKS